MGLFGQLKSHEKKRERDIKKKKISIRWDGKQGIMHNTQIQEVGIYWHMLEVKDIQQIVFVEGDKGPFYFNESDGRKQKYERRSDVCESVEITKKELKADLQRKGSM